MWPIKSDIIGGQILPLRASCEKCIVTVLLLKSTLIPPPSPKKSHYALTLNDVFCSNYPKSSSAPLSRNQRWKDSFFHPWTVTL